MEYKLLYVHFIAIVKLLKHYSKGNMVSIDIDLLFYAKITIVFR